MRTEDLPAEDRFEWWFEQVSKDTAPTVVSSPHAGDFRAAVTLADLGPVRLTVLTYPETRSVRTAALIRRSDPERHGLILTTQSAVWISQCGRDTLVGTGDLSLFDTSQPYEFQALPGADPGKTLMLHFPKTALPVRLERCRADLTDPRLRGMAVHAIGARWGLGSPADFSRAFRAAHGIPPGDYRRQALAAGRTADAE
jgi:AraC-like DNA-binding protein